MLTPTGKYRHYKGQEYEVIGTAIQTETREVMVVYRALYPTPELPDGMLFVRPQEMFLEEVEVDGKKQKRFELIEPK